MELGGDPRCFNVELGGVRWKSVEVGGGSNVVFGGTRWRSVELGGDSRWFNVELGGVRWKPVEVSGELWRNDGVDSRC